MEKRLTNWEIRFLEMGALVKLSSVSRQGKNS